MELSFIFREERGWFLEVMSDELWIMNYEPRALSFQV